MATHSSTLSWRIPWTEEPGGLQSMGSQRVRHDWPHTHPSAWPSWQPEYLDAAGSIFPHGHRLGVASRLPLRPTCFPLQGTYVPPKASRLQPSSEILPLFPPSFLESILLFLLEYSSFTKGASRRFSDKEFACNTGDLGSVPGSRRSPRGGHGNPPSILASDPRINCLILGFPRGSVVKNLPATRETWVQSLGREDPLE